MKPFITLLILFVCLGVSHSASITLLSPNGGETWNEGAAYPITWSSDGLFGDVKLSYSLNQGTDWITIETVPVSDGSYDWFILPFDNTSEEALVKIEEAGAGDGISDSSDAVFTLHIERLDIYEPNNTLETAYKLSASDSLTDCFITYRPKRDSDYYAFDVLPGDRIYFRTHAERSENDFWIEVHLLDTNGQSLLAEENDLWTSTSINFTATYAGTFYYRVTSMSGYGRYHLAFQKDTTSPELTLTSPNGGETWNEGAAYPITWSSDGLFGDVKLSYSLNQGTDWITIETVPVSDGSYDWFILPFDNTSEEALVKIEDAGAGDGTVDSSDAVFTLHIERLDIYEPNNTLETAYNLSTSDSLTDCFITYRPKRDTDYYAFDAFPGDRIYFRTHAERRENDFWIKVHLLDTNGQSLLAEKNDLWTSTSINFTATYEGTFYYRVTSMSGYGRYHLAFQKDTTSPELTLTSPNGGETWNEGAAYPITWSSDGLFGDVKLSYSLNQGTDWITIETVPVSDGSYDWFILPFDNTSEEALVKIEEAGAGDGTADSSDAVFTLHIERLDIYEPNNTLETAYKLSTSDSLTDCFITYRPKLDTDYYAFDAFPGDRIYFRTHAERSENDFWIKVHLLDTNGQSLLAEEIDLWTSTSINFTATYAGTFYYRVTTMSGYGRYHLAFQKETASPKLRLVSPNGGEHWYGGEYHEISWLSTGDIDSIKLEYSSGDEWIVIHPSFPDTGSFGWHVPNDSTRSLRLRISALDNSIRDESDSLFLITRREISLLYPNGGELLEAGNIDTIFWSATETIDSVCIEIKNDTGWSVIASPVVNNGKLVWSVPNMAAENQLVRVSTLDYSISDKSDSGFSIEPVVQTNKGYQISYNFSVDNQNFGFNSPIKKVFIYNLSGMMITEITAGGAGNVSWRINELSNKRHSTHIYIAQIITKASIEHVTFVLLPKRE
ncbi:MAG: hypothetical protein HQK83_08865 [Fibrobacteria bacterium]|nr:hypothetical protein [Fibrobacteria bacterium]